MMYTNEHPMLLSTPGNTVPNATVFNAGFTITNAGFTNNAGFDPNAAVPTAVVSPAGDPNRLRSSSGSSSPASAGMGKVSPGKGAPTVLDLCCCGGGWSVGFQAKGFDILAGVDIDTDFLAAFHHNFPHAHEKYVDLMNKKQRDHLVEGYKGKVTIVVGGSPCQGFSQTHQTPENRKTRTLLNICCCLGIDLEADVIIMENAKTVINTPEFKKAIKTLKDNGYAVQYGVLLAADYGVPQLRERTILVATRNGWSFTWPSKIGKHVTIGEALAEEPIPEQGREVSPAELDRIEGRTERFNVASRVQTLDNPSDTLLTEKGCIAILRWNTSTLRWNYFQPSVEEYLRLQSFPSSYGFPASVCETFRYKMIGNAVPPKMAAAIASGLTWNATAAPTPIVQDLMTTIEDKLDTMKWPSLRSDSPISKDGGDDPGRRGFVLGEVNQLDVHGQLVESQFNKQYPELYNLLQQLIQLYDPALKYTSIQVNMNVQRGKHKHTHNHGLSYAIALGTFEGGGLKVYHDDGSEAVYLNHRTFVPFDGRKYHESLPVTSGTRYAIVYFTAVPQQSTAQPQSRKRPLDGEEQGRRVSSRPAINYMEVDSETDDSTAPPSPQQQPGLPPPPPLLQLSSLQPSPPPQQQPSPPQQQPSPPAQQQPPLHSLVEPKVFSQPFPGFPNLTLEVLRGGNIDLHKSFLSLADGLLGNGWKRSKKEWIADRSNHVILVHFENHLGNRIAVSGACCRAEADVYYIALLRTNPKYETRPDSLIRYNCARAVMTEAVKQAGGRPIVLLSDSNENDSGRSATEAYHHLAEKLKLTITDGTALLEKLHDRVPSLRIRELMELSCDPLCLRRSYSLRTFMKVYKALEGWAADGRARAHAPGGAAYEKTAAETQVGKQAGSSIPSSLSENEAEGSEASLSETEEAEESEVEESEVEESEVVESEAEESEAEAFTAVDDDSSTDEAAMDDVSTSAPSTSPSPTSEAHGEDHGGDGGCTAVALVNIGVWPNLGAAVAALDAQIPILHAKFVRERGGCDESEAGIRGEQWHTEAIANAVKAAGWHIRTVTIHPTHPEKVSLKQELKHGSFLTIGVTNNRWVKVVGLKERLQLKYPDYPANAPAISTDGWVHSIAIVDGRVRDFHLNEPLSSLWLQGDNQPNRNKGYMRSIRKVWRVFKCTQPGTGCKGKCCISPPSKPPPKTDPWSRRDAQPVDVTEMVQPKPGATMDHHKGFLKGGSAEARAMYQKLHWEGNNSELPPVNTTDFPLDILVVNRSKAQSFEADDPQYAEVTSKYPLISSSCIVCDTKGSIINVFLTQETLPTLRELSAQAHVAQTDAEKNLKPKESFAVGGNYSDPAHREKQQDTGAQMNGTLRNDGLQTWGSPQWPGKQFTQYFKRRPGSDIKPFALPFVGMYAAEKLVVPAIGDERLRLSQEKQLPSALAGVPSHLMPATMVGISKDFSVKTHRDSCSSGVTETIFWANRDLPDLRFAVTSVRLQFDIGKQECVLFQKGSEEHGTVPGGMGSCGLVLITKRNTLSHFDKDDAYTNRTAQ